MHRLFPRHHFFWNLLLLATCVSPAAISLADATTQPSTTQPAPATKPSDHYALDPNMAASVRDAVARWDYTISNVQGGAFAHTPFREISQDGILIGFRVGIGKFFNNDTIKFIQPIYLTPKGEKRGHGYGGGQYDLFDLKAPKGYAVGCATIRGGGGLDAIKLTFMRIDDTDLDTGDICQTPQLGGNGGGEQEFNGNGMPAVGITGAFDAKAGWLGLGLIYLNPPPPPAILQRPIPKRAAPTPAPKGMQSAQLPTD
jgi:hypothetical protein